MATSHYETRQNDMTQDTFHNLLASKQKKIDAALVALIPPEITPPPLIHKAMRYSVLAEGKRIRPVLCLAACQAVGGSEDHAMPVACALEMIHTYSLVHDDLPSMDNDDFRRGRPTSHKVFGEAIAILTGDALLTLAFECIAAAPLLPAQTKILIIREVASASGTLGLVGGQVSDLSCQGRPADAESLEFIHSHKTAKLLEASVKTGSIAGGAGPEEIEAMARFGRNLGMTFQIVDDLLDVVGSREKLGKDVRKDAGLAKATYPALFGVEASRRLAGEYVQKGLEAIAFLGDKGDFLRQILHLVRDRQN